MTHYTRIKLTVLSRGAIKIAPQRGSRERSSTNSKPGSPDWELDMRLTTSSWTSDNVVKVKERGKNEEKSVSHEESRG
jgi:hypothetical protein